MCVIIARDPGITIPFDKLKAASLQNDEGWGLSVIDRGKIVTTKGYDPKGNDPEHIAKLLEDAKDQTVFLHLRIKTSGNKQLEACHPFTTLKKDTDGIDMQFMHNGTLTKFVRKDSIYPDSYHFNEEIVRPLLQRFAAKCSYEEAMLDPLFSQILHEFAGGSKFALYDGNGNFLIVNRGHGKEFEGWWASNEYSFRETSSHWYQGNRYSYGGRSEDSTPFDVTGRSSASSSTALLPRPANGQGNAGSAGSSATTPPTTTASPLTDEGEALATKVYDNMGSGKTVVPLFPEERDTFKDLTGLDLNDACYLEEEDIQEAIDLFPDIMKVLIMDLLFELYQKNKSAKDKEENLRAVG